MPLPRHTIKLSDEKVEMPFRLIPAGSFRMGGRGRSLDEEPVHAVEIPEPFWMAETPVTQAQFALWTRAGESGHQNHFSCHPDSPARPAESMSWFEARAYCSWLTRTAAACLPGDRQLACLPSEAQWEYACRAGTEADYHRGEGEAALAEVGWFGEDFVTGSTHPVGQKLPNAFGLFDMHGNVDEWCEDVFDPKAYSKRVGGWEAKPWAEADAGGDLHFWTDDQRERNQPSRVLRGGSWIAPALDCRSAFRRGIEPVDRCRSIGFRVCLVRGPARLVQVRDR